MKKYPATLLVLLYLGVPNSFAQNDFREGYIIKTNNDTIYGLINYKGNKASAKKCTYKSDKKAGKRDFLPEEILAYRFIDGKYYVSKEIKIDETTEEVFLEYLIDGTVDIYFYNDTFGKDHYLLDNGDGHLTELKNEKKDIYRNNQRYTLEYKEYVGVLKNTFKDSEGTIKGIDNLKLGHKPLIGIAKNYHEDVCSDGQCVVFEKKKPKEKIMLGVTVGLNSVAARIESESIYYFRGANFDEYTFPDFGVFLKGHLPGINNNVFIRYELNYNHTKLVSSDSAINFTARVQGMTLEQRKLNNFLALSYEFPKGKIRPTFQAGVVFSYLFDSRNIRGSEPFWDLSSGREVYEINGMSKYEFGGVLSGGLIGEIKNKQISLDLRYQLGYRKGQVKEVEGYYNFFSNIYSINLGVQLW